MLLLPRFLKIATLLCFYFFLINALSILEQPGTWALLTLHICWICAGPARANRGFPGYLTFLQETLLWRGGKRGAVLGSEDQWGPLSSVPSTGCNPCYSHVTWPRRQLCKESHLMCANCPHQIPQKGRNVEWFWALSRFSETLGQQICALFLAVLPRCRPHSNMTSVVPHFCPVHKAVSEIKNLTQYPAFSLYSDKHNKIHAIYILFYFLSTVVHLLPTACQT